MQETGSRIGNPEARDEDEDETPAGVLQEPGDGV